MLNGVRLLCVLVGMGLACGGRSGEVRLGGETNWFGWCESNADCLSGECVCGICTTECSAEAPSCAGGPPGSVCALPNGGGFPGLCSSETPSGVCLGSCSESDACEAGLECVAGWCLSASSPLGPTAGGPDLPREPELANRLCAGSSILGGTWEVRTRDELERFRGCTEIDDLTVDTRLVPSLEPLSELRVVHGELSIGPNVLLETTLDNPIRTLAGLENLQSVESLSLTSFGDADLGALARLTRVGRLWLSELPNLTSLGALRNVRVERGLLLSSLPELDDLSGPSLATELSQLSLIGLPSLSDLTPLRALTSAEFLTIGGLVVTSLDGLAGIGSIASASIGDNPNLLHLDGLQSLRSLDTLYITGNPLLENVDGLSNLEALGDLQIHDNAALTHLPEFSRIASVAQVTLERNAALRTGPSFPALESGNLRVTDNPQLETLSGFANLGFASSEVFVVRNGSLREITLSTLRYAGNLEITDNPNLVRLDVSGLVSVGGFGVHDNQSLAADGISAHPEVAWRFGLPVEEP